MENSEAIHRAIQTAIAAVQEIYKDENISDVEVEEIERGSWEGGTPSDWLITVGFTREKPRQTLGGLALPQRDLKVVKIGPSGDTFKGMTIRNPSTEYRGR